jgi:hypothetical protein
VRKLTFTNRPQVAHWPCTSQRLAKHVVDCVDVRGQGGERHAVYVAAAMSKPRPGLGQSTNGDLIRDPSPGEGATSHMK